MLYIFALLGTETSGAQHRYPRDSVSRCNGLFAYVHTRCTSPKPHIRVIEQIKLSARREKYFVEKSSNTQQTRREKDRNTFFPSKRERERGRKGARCKILEITGATRSRCTWYNCYFILVFFVRAAALNKYGKRLSRRERYYRDLSCLRHCKRVLWGS